MECSYTFVEHLAYTAREENLLKMIEKLINEVNEHAEKGHIIGHLSPLGLMELIPGQLTRREFAVYCFPLFTKAGSIYLKETYNRI